MMEQSITSVQNPRVKQWAQLMTKKGRDKQGRFIVEGTHLVQEALKQSSYSIECVVYSEERGIPAELTDQSSRQFEWISVSESVLSKCASTPSPQSIFAVLSHNANKDWRPLLSLPQSLVVLVDGVQDPGNVGTIIRSADASGADAVFLGRGTADLYNPKILRATMGSLFHLPVIECDLLEILEHVKEQPSVQVVNTSLQAEQTCYTSDFTLSTWFVLGNEGQGVSKEVAAFVNHAVAIPMEGQAESLNVAMAATVLLFETMRQRKFSNNYNP